MPFPWNDEEVARAEVGQCFGDACEALASTEIRVQTGWRSKHVHVWWFCDAHAMPAILSWAGVAYWVQFEPIGVELQELPLEL